MEHLRKQRKGRLDKSPPCVSIFGTGVNRKPTSAALSASGAPRDRSGQRRRAFRPTPVQAEFRPLKKGRKARKTAHKLLERRRAQRHVAEFAAGARLLAVKMKMGRRNGQS